MFRTVAAALAALFVAAPAMAQQSDLLTAGAWECKVVSLLGQPQADVLINYDVEGGLQASFSMAILSDEDVIRVEIEIVGDWSLQGSVITVVTTGTDIVNAWQNDVELPFNVVEQMGESIEAEMMAGPSESSIAYLAEHAMVLAEADASSSCWR
jgi:hypothetical protein